MHDADGALAALLTPARLARWAARRAERDDAVLRATWALFVERGGPVALDAVAAALRNRPRAEVRAAAEALDTRDLVVLAGDTIRVAYPFDTGPTAFPVILTGDRRRYACCAIDALGVAPMIGAPARAEARCHRSGAAIAVTVDPESGPETPSRGEPAWRAWRVWVETGAWDGGRLSGGL
jgi:hypothetical protein